MNPKLRVVAERQGGVFSRRQALDAGYTPAQIGSRLGDGRWERVRHGQYAERADPHRMEPWDRDRWNHCRRIYAALNAIRPGAVAASHQSALALHGLPLWGMNLTHVHVTRLDEQSGGLLAGVQHHLGRMIDRDLMELDGVLVTTPIRAVAEAATRCSFEAAVVAADAVLRDHDVSEADVCRQLETTAYWPGGVNVRAALRFADGRAESAGESRLRVLLDRHQLPAPDLQVEFHDSAGFVARVDFCFPAYGTVLEFDGRVKYTSGSSEVLIREKAREDRLRGLGLQVVRSDWSDLDRPAQLLATLHQAFARSARTAA